MKISDMRYYTFFILLFNFLNIGAGALVIAFCVLDMRKKHADPEYGTQMTRGVLSFFITLALFTIVTAVLGFFGALRKHIKVLYVAVCFYIFLISIELIVFIGVLLVHVWAGRDDDVRLNFYRNVTGEEDAARQQSWDNLQVQLYCCGVDGPHDYAVINRDIPSSCCATAHPLREGGAKRHLHSTCLKERTYYMRGCDDVLKSEKRTRVSVSSLCFSVLVIVEIGIVAMSLCMVNRIRRQRRQLQHNLQAHFES